MTGKSSLVLDLEEAIGKEVVEHDTLNFPVGRFVTSDHEFDDVLAALDSLVMAHKLTKQLRVLHPESGAPVYTIDALSFDRDRVVRDLLEDEHHWLDDEPELHLQPMFRVHDVWADRLRAKKAPGKVGS